MPTERNNPIASTANRLDSNLLEELEKIAKLAFDKTSSSEEHAHALALIRILTGVCQDEWEQFASGNNLENWSGVHVDCALAKTISQALSSHKCPACAREHNPLTGVGNHKFFSRLIKAECDRAQRSHTDLSLLMLALDAFTKDEDTPAHSHDTLEIQRLGALLRARTRHYDVSAHLGDENFALILPGTSCWAALVVGNRLLEHFRQKENGGKENARSMTFSGGVASLACVENDENYADQLVKAANEALCKAKRQGSSTIALAESHKRTRDRSSLVLSQEKQFLFSCLASE